MKFVYMSSSPYGLKKRKLQDLWEIICGPRIDSEPCSAIVFVSKPWMAWNLHPLALRFSLLGVLAVPGPVSKIPLLTYDMLNGHDL